MLIILDSETVYDYIWSMIATSTSGNTNIGIYYKDVDFYYHRQISLENHIFCNTYLPISQIVSGKGAMCNNTLHPAFVVRGRF